MRNFENFFSSSSVGEENVFKALNSITSKSTDADGLNIISLDVVHTSFLILFT